MLKYHDYEKAVFDWLMARRENDPNFTFSTRKKIGKGQENDIFIGTENSKYFATTFWALRIDYPGSSGEATGIIFKLGKTDYSYFIELNQTNKPHNEQNQGVLRSLKKIFSKLPPDLKYAGNASDTNAMFNVKILPIEQVYGNLEFMFADIDKQLALLEPIVDEVLAEEKLLNPNFIGQRITNVEFDHWLKKLESRLSINKNSLEAILCDFEDVIAYSYFEHLRRLIVDLDLDINSQKIYFNYEKDSLIFGIGQYYALNLSNKGFYRILSKSKGNDAVEFAEGKAYLNNYPISDKIEGHYDELYLIAKEILSVTNKSGYYKYDKQDFRDKVFKNLTSSSIEVKQPTSTLTLNQILYGPPGTGKTYTTIEKAIAIANPAFNLKQDRAAVKAEYKRLCDVKQIEFITFHQSLSYEDFVEGIKPDIEEDKDGVRSVVYKINDGLFKTIVNRARVIPIDEVNQKFYHFDDAWNALVEMVQKSIENQQDFLLDILTLKKGLQVTEITNNGNLRLTPKSSPGLEYTVSYSRLKELHKAVPSLSQVKNIDKEFRAVIGGMNSTTYWATLNFVNNWLEQSNKTKTNKLPSANVLPHVLIIDEINRGNVSQIFGELITLLEEDKREGEPEALQVTLPYSKERFSVPKNLYIIGTMNTADRSVEALDTALRRRFAFEEMLPNPYHEKIENVEDISLQNVLAVINTRLEKLLSRDHTIGHSFFIGVTTEKRLYSAFYDKIIPLLQEYFFGDYGKIGLVLGKAFVEEVSSEKDFSFADFEYEEQDLLLEKRVYRINRFDKGGDDFLGAVKAIYIKGNPS